MTKPREPDTIHDAVRCVMVLVGDKELAHELDCSPQLLQAYSDKDDEREITGQRMIKADALLVRRGFDPVFAPLLARLALEACPNLQAATEITPTAAVMAITGTMGKVLATMAGAAGDGLVTATELQECLDATGALRTDIAKCRRTLFAAQRKLTPPPAKPAGKARR